MPDEEPITIVPTPGDGFTGFDDTINQSDIVPYDSTGMDNKFIGIDDKTRDKFGITYDQQLANFDERDYRLCCMIGQHIQTLETIEGKLGKTDCLLRLKDEYMSKIAFRAGFSKSKDMALLKTIRTSYLQKSGHQTFKQDLGPQPKEKRKLLGITLPI